MRPPRFWSHSPKAPGLVPRLLAPLGLITASATARRVAKPAAYRPGLPVICVGNINVGGTGKTPTVIALIEALSRRRITAHVISRGYGGSLAGPVAVNERVHSADETGDEPLLLSAFAPTWVARDRAAGARAAEDAGAQALILDDGFQNPVLAKDLSVVVVDAAAGFGNGFCMPAGPLREPVVAGLARADAVLTIGDSAAQAQFDGLWPLPAHPPRLQADMVPLQTGMMWPGLRVLAFAGIGRPEKFFATLRALGAEIVQSVALDDHQPLNSGLMTRLQADAAKQGAQLVTTEKDAVRLPQSLRRQVLTVPVRLRWQDEAALEDLLNGLAFPGG